MTTFEKVIQEAFAEYQANRKDENSLFAVEWSNDWHSFYEWLTQEYIPNAYSSEFVESLFPNFQS